MVDPLVVRNLKKTFRSRGVTVKALNGVSFRVKKGEIFGLLGPNGAGKTTVTNILNGILTSDSGEVRFFGKEACEETKNRVNVATAYNALNGIMSVYQNLRVYGMIYNIKNVNKKIDELLEMFEIEDLKNMRVWDLSAGQKTRVNLCKCLINSPDLIFLDEATVGLDPHIANKVRKIIKKIDATIILTSHIMHEVEELCDRIAFLNKGKILKIDTPSGIKQLIGKNDEFVIDFLSIPKGASEILDQFDLVLKKKDKVIVRLKEQKDIHRVIHTLVTNDFKIRDFHIKRATLDEVFIKIARGEV